MCRFGLVEFELNGSHPQSANELKMDTVAVAGEWPLLDALHAWSCSYACLCLLLEATASRSALESVENGSISGAEEIKFSPTGNKAKAQAQSAR